MTHLLAAAVLAALILAAPVDSQPGRHLAVIVNRSNPAENLSVAELRNILLGRRTRWPDGRRITVVMRDPGHAERQALLKTVCGMTDSEFEEHLARALYTGEVGAAPKRLATEDGVRKFVFNVPGAIGYLRAGEMDKSVKALRIDGQAPGENGYRIAIP